MSATLTSCNPTSQSQPSRPVTGSFRLTLAAAVVACAPILNGFPVSVSWAFDSPAQRGDGDRAEHIDREPVLTLAPKLSPDSAAAEKALRKLPARFRVAETDRFLLLSDAEPEVVQAHAQWVERAHQEFMRFAEKSGLRPSPLRHKLVGVFFEHRDEYRAFAREHDGITNAAFSGYYSPRNDRVVFWLENDADTHRAGKNPRKGHPTKEVLGFDPSGSPDRGHAPQGCCSGESAAKCVHETIHQLMFHTRIMSPNLQYPLWICEGLSTAFETSAPDQPFGPDYDYMPRVEVFQRLLRQDDLMPLRKLVSIAQLRDEDAQDIKKVYHQSYALVTWLSRHRAADLRAYLDLMRTEPPGKLTPSRHLAIFEQAFGPADALERQWLNYERGLDQSKIAVR
ncbi:MAG: DUF1570 domain-containing protein [Phycisphaerales bacterium]|nr:DUF1570 domain-containing protein [Phycisphaerales bacterium]MCI0630758.1 DUF1570 domain-containing protein [Phycisphaerales bacterium]MCI0674382.1 DUF1570 domain-containing protein [Phycisphaerales bacterium]